MHHPGTGSNTLEGRKIIRVEKATALVQEL
jgi:hypothetical protein